MFKTTALFSFILISITLPAQEFLWSIRGGCFNPMENSQKHNRVLEITSDSEGNTYLLAQSGSLDIFVADISLTGYADVNYTTDNHQFNLVLASFTANGEYRWSKVIGGEKDTYGYSLQTDNLGHVYLSGRVYPLQPTVQNTPVHFDTDTILPQSWEMDEYKKIMYLAQYDTDGNFKWLHMPEPDTVSQVSFWANNSYPYKSDVDPASGDVYWHCLLREGQFDWAEDNIIEEESDYILRYNSDGQVTGRVKLDMRSSGANTVSNQNYTYFERDHETGNFYIAGTQVSTYEPLIIGGDTIAGTAYAAAFSPDGALLWLIEGDSGGIYDMKIEDGYIYFTGRMPDGAEFNGHVFELPEPTSSSPFTMKLDYEGNTQWAHIAASDISSTSESLAIRGNEVAITGRCGTMHWPGTNSTDTIYVETNKGYDSHISRFDKNTGELIGLESYSTINDGNAFTQKIYAHDDCEYYIGGGFNDQLVLGSDTLLHFGSTEQTYFFGRYSFASELEYTFAPTGTPGSFEFTAQSNQDSITWDFGDDSPHITGTSVTHIFSEPGEYLVCAATSGDCGSEYCDTVVVLSTGIRELADRLHVYPNPAVGEIRIDGLDQPAQYSLISPSGAIVKQGWLSSGISINVSDLSRGIYVLLLTSEDGQQARAKVAVQTR